MREGGRQGRQHEAGRGGNMRCGTTGRWEEGGNMQGRQHKEGGEEEGVAFGKLKVAPTREGGGVSWQQKNNKKMTTVRSMRRRKSNRKKEEIIRRNKSKRIMNKKEEITFKKAGRE